MTKEELQELKRYTLSKQYLEDMAYAIWEGEGKPDGEQVVETFIWFGLIKSGKMKLKDTHWQKAEMVRDSDMEIIRDLEVIFDNDDCKWKGL